MKFTKTLASIAAAAIAVSSLAVSAFAADALVSMTVPVSYTHLRAHETGRNLVCRLLLEKKKKKKNKKQS